MCSNDRRIYIDGTRPSPHTFFLKNENIAIRPLHNRIVVKRVEAEEKTASGIVLPGAAAEKPDMGEVIAVGAGKRGDNGERQALDVKVGDKVIFGKYSGQTVKVDGQELLVMKEDEVFAIMD